MLAHEHFDALLISVSDKVAVIIVRIVHSHETGRFTRLRPAICVVAHEHGGLLVLVQQLQCLRVAQVRNVHVRTSVTT